MILDLENNNQITPLLTLGGTIFTVAGGFIGYYIKNFLDKKKEINSENHKVKREMYKKFVSLIFDLFKKSKRNEIQKKVDTNLQDQLYIFYEDYALYSSPKTINSLGDCMQYLYKNNDNLDVKITMKKLSNVIKQMRKELGLSNRGLGRDGEKIFKAMFTDFDKIAK